MAKLTRDYSNFIPDEAPNEKQAWDDWKKRHSFNKCGDNMVYSGRSTQNSPRHMKHQGTRVNGIRIK